MLNILSADYIQSMEGSFLLKVLYTESVVVSILLLFTTELINCCNQCETTEIDQSKDVAFHKDNLRSICRINRILTAC